MNILKKMLVGVCASLLTLMLFSFGLSWSAYKVLGTPGPIKGALKESGIYQTGIRDALKQAQKDPQNKPDGQKSELNIAVDKPEVQQLIQNAVPPQYLQTQVESLLDTSYAWVQGSSSKLSFSLDVQDLRNRLANGLGDFVQNKLNTLPTCTAGQAGGEGDFDPFNATCVPAGLNKAETVAKAKDQILQGDFLQDTKVSTDSIKNDKGETLDQQFKMVPTVYHKVKLALGVLAGLMVVLALGVVFCSINWRSGVRKLSIILLSVGALSALLALLSGIGVHRAVVEFGKTKEGTQPLQQKIVHIAELLIGDLRSCWLWYGLTLLVIGILGLVAIHFLKPKALKDEENKVLAHKLEPAVEAEPKAEDGKKPAKAKLPEIKQ